MQSWCRPGSANTKRSGAQGRCKPIPVSHRRQWGGQPGWVSSSSGHLLVMVEDLHPYFGGYILVYNTLYKWIMREFFKNTNNYIYIYTYAYIYIYTNIVSYFPVRQTTSISIVGCWYHFWLL